MARALLIANPANATTEELKQVYRVGSNSTATRWTAIQILIMDNATWPVAKQPIGPKNWHREGLKFDLHQAPGRAETKYGACLLFLLFQIILIDRYNTRCIILRWFKTKEFQAGCSYTADAKIIFVR